MFTSRDIPPHLINMENPLLGKSLRKTVTSFTDVLFPISKEAQDPQQYQLKKTGLLHPTGDIYLHGHGLSILSKFEQIVLKHNNLNKLISY
jgi:hypothetical protein